MSASASDTIPGGHAGPERALARAVRAIAARPLPVLALVLVAVAALGLLGTRVGVDPGNEALFLADDPARPALERFQRHFESDQTVLVALEGPILTEDGLARLERLRAEVAKVPGVLSTLALTNAKNIYQGPVEVYGWAPYEKLTDGDMTLEEFKAEVLHEPLFAGNLISNDGRLAAIVCALASRDARIVEELRALARGATDAPPGMLPPERRAATPDLLFTGHVAGNPVERVEFAGTIDRDQRIFLPLVVATLAVLCAILFRQAWGVLLPLAVVGASVATTMGVAALAGIELNAVTSMLRPVVMVVSIAVSVNYLMAFAQAKAEEPSAGGVGEGFPLPGQELPPGAPRLAAVEAAARRVGLPCLFTTLTNAAGFASLGTSEVPAIKVFGLLCATGVAVSWFLALLILPPLLALEWGRGPGSLGLRPGRLEAILARAAPALERRRWWALLGAAAMIAFAVLGIARIRVETDIMSNLPEGGELRTAARAIDRSLSGVNAIEVLVEGPKGALRTLAGQRSLAAIQRWFEARKDIAKTFSVANILERIHEVKRKQRALPESDEVLATYFGILEQAAGKKIGETAPGASTGTAAKKEDPLKGFMSSDYSAARVIVRMRAAPASEVMAVLDAFRADAPKLVAPGLTATPTGEFVLLQDMTAALPFAMLHGLIWATALIIGAMGLLFRSVRLAAIAALPASIPIVFVYGLMGWTGIWLSVPTAMISSVVLGLAVDSTILFLSRYRDERLAGRDRRGAVEHMLLHAGQSVTYSNLTLIFGFAVGVSSNFPPIRDFSLLTSLTIAASYGGALALLPALIFVQPEGSITGRRQPEEKNA